MKIEFEIRPNDELVKNASFNNYRNTATRRAEQYLPAEGEPEEISITTPWGEQLTCRKGDYIVSETGGSEDHWPVAADIFEQTYVQVKPGYYIKRATVPLTPLTELTGQDPDMLVTIHTMEGVVRVRSGDFFLARGIKGEIWPIPVEKVQQTMILVDDEENRTSA